LKKIKIGVIVQARMSSQRLPAKVLTKINEKPLLQYLVERLENCSSINEIIIATSDAKSDDPIASFCDGYGVRCFRGSLKNVAKRFYMVLEEFNLDVFVRICGDSPIIDPKLIDKGVELFDDSSDLVTNIWPRSYPLGQSVEVVRATTFKKIFKKMTKMDHLEHVTKYYYDHSDKFKIMNFSNETNLSKYCLAVDKPEDLKRVKKIILSMTKPQTQYNLDDLIELYPLTKKLVC
jgi:spore coat polysaccharide biosynthesis protein SpsF